MSLVNKNTTKGLGRGIEVLLPQDFDRSILLEEGERVQKVRLESVEPQFGQPRKEFDQEALQQLANSITRHGILQPLIVTPANANGSHTIIAGERRWRAAGIAGLKHVPVIVRSAKEQERLEIALVENVQRVDLSPIEQATTIEHLHQQFNLTYESIGERLGKAISTISNIVRLLQLPPDAIKALNEHQISEGHARGIVALGDHPEGQVELLHSIIKYGWSVRQTERFVVAYKKGRANAKIAHERVQTESPETKLLSKHIKAPVTVRRTAHGGKLEIGFKTEADLKRLIKNFLQS